MVKSKVNKAQKIRSYLSANPDAKPSEIAKALKMSVQYVYQVMHKMKPKKVAVTYAGAEAAKQEGLSTAEYAEKVYKMTKGRVRIHPITGKRLMDGPVVEHQTDMVNHPPHYTAGGIETIDYIEAKELGYHLGNVVKYVSRADHKGQKLEDLNKAAWYLNRAIRSIENENKDTR
jgi:Protein of unknwon function (DUF3310)